MGVAPQPEVAGGAEDGAEVDLVPEFAGEGEEGEGSGAGRAV